MEFFAGNNIDVRNADFYVSTAGNDFWSGKLAQPNAEKTDGPFATIIKARDAVRDARISGTLSGLVTVWIRGGRYPITNSLCFGPDDSAPVSYVAYPGEQPVVDGGRAVGHWREEVVNGVPMWVADVPGASGGNWYFRQLFVNGSRRNRTRLPKQGYYWMENVPGIGLDAEIQEGTYAFQCAEGDIRDWKNITDAEIIVLHYWTEERMPVASFDKESRIVRSSRRSIFALKDDVGGRYAKYYVENVFEALTEPGEWYLDRPAGKLYYIPMQGEELGKTSIFASSSQQLLRLEGDPGMGRFVELLQFKGITFEHADWSQPAGGGGFLVKEFGWPDIEYAAAHQSAFNVPGAIFLKGARHCAIEDCTVRHVGGFGIELSEGCMGNRVVGNEISDIGAGGVKLGGADVYEPHALRTGNNRIMDNHIFHGGRVFQSAPGILSAHSFGNVMSHNHIHDLFNSGITCGWVWGYTDNVSKDNKIEKNHIHDLGHGLLSDMGGVYMLGVQPGTVIRGNVIHDIEKCNYGGWAVYLDEGSSHILVESNICYNTSSQGFHQHFGRENTVRNNIFAFGGEGQVCHSRADANKGFTFIKNIVLSFGQPFFVGGYAGQLEKRNFISDMNLFWDCTGKGFSCGNAGSSEGTMLTLSRYFSFEEWRRMGYDLHSMIADPIFKDVRNRDFTLADNSPAFSLGFTPIDNSDAGPRPKDIRLEE